MSDISKAMNLLLYSMKVNGDAALKLADNYEKMLEFVKKISTQDWLDESNASDAYAEIGFLTNMADDLLEEMGMTDE